MDRVKQSIHYWCKDTKSNQIRGKGICVAVLDTGAEAHPDLGNRVKAFRDFVNRRVGMYDDSGHGTHVAGIIAGNGRLSGGRYEVMAPEAELVMVKVLNQKGEGSLEQIEAGIQWVQKNRKQYRIQIVNLSVGAKADLDSKKAKELICAVEQLWDAGMIVVVSAGNYGPGEGSIAIPGTSRKVITVGAVSDRNTQNNCSGNGPTDQCVVKPDVVAPGYGILSLNRRYQDGNVPYVRKSGSSMATPVVAGAMSLLLEKYPDMSNVESKLRLRESCDKRKDFLQIQGWGMINVNQLLR